MFFALLKDIGYAMNIIHKIQKRATKLVIKLKTKSYTDRLFYLNIPAQKFRHLRGDVIEVFKIMHNVYDTTVMFLSVKALTPEAIIINCIVILFSMTYESIFLSARIVNIWNSLPNSVVDACTVNAFESWLDKFWQHQAVKFDFAADLTGSGN